MAAISSAMIIFVLDVMEASASETQVNTYKKLITKSELRSKRLEQSVVGLRITTNTEIGKYSTELYVLDYPDLVLVEAFARPAIHFPFSRRTVRLPSACGGVRNELWLCA